MFPLSCSQAANQSRESFPSMCANYVSLFVATILIAALPQDKEVQSVAANFEVQKLAEGIFAVIRKDPPGLLGTLNHT